MRLKGLVLLIVALALTIGGTPLTAETQGAKVPHVGVIVPGSSFSFAPRVEAFRQGLHDLGYVEGQNLVVEYRFADGKPERFPVLASELVRLNVQVIVANVGEAVELGIVASLARPGGNVTGSSYLMLDLVTKRLEALREILRRVRRVAVLWNPTNQVHGPALRGLETAARPLGLDLHVTAARNLDEIEATFSTIANEGVGALVVLDDGVFVHHRTRLASLALQKRLPTIHRAEGASRGRRPHGIWPKPDRISPARCHLRRQDPQRRKARRPPRRTGDNVRLGDQSENGKGVGIDDPPILSSTGR
jgi:putative tryptophan/tyrosine transport system substrate-binding protein